MRLATSPKRNTAPGRPVGYQAIAARLRAKILDGTCAPGQRLPTHLELERQFATTTLTVSRALAVLRQDGFIRAERRRGTFVAQHLPHQSQYGLVFTDDPDHSASQFYRALHNEATAFAEAGRRFIVFCNITEHADTEDHQRLLGFVRAHRLAGLIFAAEPGGLVGSPLLEEPGIPRVAIASESKHAGVPAVSPDLHGFVPKALDYLARRGRRRVALLRLTPVLDLTDQEAADFRRETAARGLVTHPAWIQSVHPYTLRTANEAAQLLLFAAPHKRPDALIIRDDNLLPHASAGLLATGVRIPEQLDVVAHTNFPAPTASAVPVRRLGYDVRQLFEICVARVDALRRGEQPPLLTRLPAVFEDELLAKSPTADVGVAR